MDADKTIMMRSDGWISRRQLICIEKFRKLP